MYVQRISTSNAYQIDTMIVDFILTAEQLTRTTNPEKNVSNVFKCNNSVISHDRKETINIQLRDNSRLIEEDTFYLLIFNPDGEIGV